MENAAEGKNFYNFPLPWATGVNGIFKAAQKIKEILIEKK